jgi:RNA polymerase sigma-70 factor, ECF subfamily
MMHRTDNGGDAIFEQHRDRLFGLAYRMTGSVADAHDICQDAWPRWQAVDRSTVDNAEAYLVRIATRLAIDRSRSAHARREAYVGAFLPEPVVTDRGAERAGDPEVSAVLADSMTFAFLVVLDELAPIERAVFVLHDVFGYSFDEVAIAVERSPAACRQVASRTRKRIHDHPLSLRRASDADEASLLNELITRTIHGDIPGVMALLAPDVVQLDDGGALRRAARHPIVGPDRVARFFVNLAKRIQPTTTVDVVNVNGRIGLLFREGDTVDMVITFAMSPENSIRRIYTQLNADKLRHLNN